MVCRHRLRSPFQTEWFWAHDCSCSQWLDKFEISFDLYLYEISFWCEPQLRYLQVVNSTVYLHMGVAKVNESNAQCCTYSTVHLIMSKIRLSFTLLVIGIFLDKYIIVWLTKFLSFLPSIHCSHRFHLDIRIVFF